KVSHILAGAAALSFLVSVTGTLPSKVVETYYSRPIFPSISHIAGLLADAVPFSWFDAIAVLGLPLLLFMAPKKRLRFLFVALAAGYLIFFWGWGLNYHREPIESKLALDGGKVSNKEMEEFTKLAADELNRLWPMTAAGSLDVATISEKAAGRVRTVVDRVDG